MQAGIPTHLCHRPTTNPVYAHERAPFALDTVTTAAQEEALLASCSTIEEWQSAAEQLLGEQNCVLVRNRRITATYARTYLKHPKLFKWTCMAAFASHHIRLALKPFSLLGGGGGCIDPETFAARRQGGFRNAVIIKEINDAIFNDIFWAHLAYDGSAAGLARLETAIGDDQEGLPILNGFRLLDEARQLFEKEPDSEEAEEMAWEANVQILRHEQEAMVQPSFDQLKTTFSRSLSLMSTMHYHHGGRCKRALVPGSFVLYMLFQRQGEKLGSFPSITNLDHRWEWISEGILPGFRCYESDKELIQEDLEKLIAQAPRP